MNLNSIDMSFAVHKNTDAAQIQKELLNKPTADQTALAQSGMKTDADNRQKAAKLDQTDKSAIRDEQRKRGRKKDDEKNGKGAQGEASSVSADMQRSNEALHPYKGRHIDFSL